MIEEKFSKLIDFTTSLLEKQQEEDDKWRQELQSLRDDYFRQFEAQTQKLLAREQDLEKLKEENSTLKEKLDKSEKSLEEYKSLEFLSEMSGVCIPSKEGSRNEPTTEPHVFLLTSGDFEGMKFSLAYDPLQEEYNYRVLELSNNIPKDSDFRNSFCFPQDMLQMFFYKLLRSHYNTTDHSL